MLIEINWISDSIVGACGLFVDGFTRETHHTTLWSDCHQDKLIQNERKRQGLFQNTRKLKGWSRIQEHFRACPEYKNTSGLVQNTRTFGVGLEYKKTWGWSRKQEHLGLIQNTRKLGADPENKNIWGWSRIQENLGLIQKTRTFGADPECKKTYNTRKLEADPEHKKTLGWSRIQEHLGLVQNTRTFSSGPEHLGWKEEQIVCLSLNHWKVSKDNQPFSRMDSTKTVPHKQKKKNYQNTRSMLRLSTVYKFTVHT